MCHIFTAAIWAAIGHVLSFILTPLIAAIAVSIAWQQFVVNRRQYRLALFEKRMAVFNSTMKMIASVVRAGDATPSECFEFIQDTRNHEFLFEPEVATFIDEVFKKAMAIHTLPVMGSSPSAAKRTELLEWFANQMDVARKIFLRYLDFRKP